MHGADFYASKKHKGSGEDGNGGTGGGIDGSPRSDDGAKTASLSSPSIKSESDVHSPQAQDSPIGGQDMDTMVRVLSLLIKRKLVIAFIFLAIDDSWNGRYSRRLDG